MRQALTKKIRFEVFKRDSFTCQYCGAKSPDVVLHCDHIEPVSKGGTNNILNLLTACDSCNGGKSATRLSDESAIEKSRKQAELLQARREQIEMIAAWYADLASQDNLEVEKVLAVIPSVRTLSDNGWKFMRRSIRKYGLAEILECTKISFDQYYKETDESWEKAVNMIPRIAHCQQLRKTDPALAEAHRLRGILKTKINYIDYQQALDILATLVDRDQQRFAEAICRDSRSWNHFRTQAAEVLQ